MTDGCRPVDPKRIGGYAKIAAPCIDVCKNCGASNHGRAITLWRVADERGLHYECDGCGEAWAWVKP